MSVTTIVKNEPTTAPQIPASSGSRESPAVKKRVLNFLYPQLYRFWELFSYFFDLIITDAGEITVGFIKAVLLV